MDFLNRNLCEFRQVTSLLLVAAVEVGLVLLEVVQVREEEVALVAEEPLLRHDVGVMLVGVPIEVPGLVEGLQADGASDPHATEAGLVVRGGRVVLEDRHSREVHLAHGAHQPSVNDVLKMHLK